MCPARIHCTWLGYLATTGLQAMDFRLCDALTDPPGQAEAWQSEKPLRMPDSQWCYEPQVSLPECSVLPYSRKGCWTFGSFNQGTKINGEVLRAWAACLLAIPGSRLLVHGVTESLLTDRIGAAMASHGIGPERYEVRGRTSIDEYFVAFQEVDVALDTFPYNGGTTTCDALIMGVPVATVCGARSVSRGGLSILSTIGLKHWIADCVADLPEMLVRNLDNVEEMARLRAGLRERMQASALMDAPKFVRNLEHLLAEALNAPP